MLDFQSQLKSGVKPLELVVFDPFGLMPKTLIGWESLVDPRYTDFSEVEFLSIAPYKIVEKAREV